MSKSDLTECAYGNVRSHRVARIVDVRIAHEHQAERHRWRCTCSGIEVRAEVGVDEWQLIGSVDEHGKAEALRRGFEDRCEEVKEECVVFSRVRCTVKLNEDHRGDGELREASGNLSVPADGSKTVR